MARIIGPLLLGAILGVLAGIAGASFLFGDGESQRSFDALAAGRPRAALAKDAGASDAAMREGANVPSIAQPVPVFVEAERTTAELESAPPEVVDRLVAATKSAPPPELRRGGRSLRGRVLDRDGRPVADTVVRASRQGDSERTPSRSRVGEDAPPIDALDEVVKTAVRNYYDRRADARESVTDADGRYAFDDVRDGRWWVQAWRDGFEVTPKGEASVRPDATVDFTAAPVVRVDVAVLLADGSAAPRALIQVKRPGERSTRRNDAWSPDQRHLSFAAGEWELKATLGDPDLGPTWPDFLASAAQTVLLADGASPTLTFRLIGSPGVRGEIRAPGSTARRQLLVKLELLPAGTAPDLKTLANDHSATNVWARDGKYVFKDLAPGRYVVAASRSWNERITAHAVVEVRDSMVVQDLEIPPLDRARCVVARVLDPDGRLIDNVSFTLNVESGESGSSSGGVEAERQPDGTWLVPVDRSPDENFDLSEAWPAGTKVTLIAQNERFGQKSVELASSTRSVEVSFGSPATLIATVQGYAGSGYEGRVQLSLTRVEETERQHRHFGIGGRDKIAADGTQRFGPVEAGRHRLDLSIRSRGDDHWSNAHVASLELDLAIGENRATVAIPALYSLTIEVPDGKGSNLQLRNAKDEENDYSNFRHVELDESGRATFENLRAGEYLLQHFGSDEHGSMRVTVPTSGIVRFVATPMNALVVYVSDAQGRLAKAGFLGGDHVIGVGGVELATAKELQDAISAALAKKQVAFTLLREGKRIEMTVDASVLSDPFAIGGGFRPAVR